MILPDVTHNDLMALVSKKTGKAFLSKSNALKEAEMDWESHLAKFTPSSGLRGALRADLRLCWSTNGKHPQGSLKETKPDLDNTEKTFWDVLGRLGFFEVGDQQVAQKLVTKMWADPAGVYLKLEEVDV